MEPRNLIQLNYSTFEDKMPTKDRNVDKYGTTEKTLFMTFLSAIVLAHRHINLLKSHDTCDRNEFIRNLIRDDLRVYFLSYLYPALTSLCNI